ncbi:histidinol-phosphate transaminase [Bacillus sp. RG28]|uniref:Histidinol-phosphate aminotransferase n=1 Tax=Gottfriedia endophytica TaxID=2820819 RepID=A0A940SJL3_9BACI|nr:histidinol-phosphate transaminase [Gottfriedia endophytica]MBP0726155.1 histidinol-phosphate transaminase [Gottfriedia endophytica]
MHVKPQILTLQAYKPGKPSEIVKREYGLDKVVKLASNENPFGCSSKVFEAIKTVADQFAIYPDGASEALSKKVAAFLNVTPEELLFGSGADEVIQIITRGLLKSENNIVCATPTFPQYAHHAVVEGAEVRSVPLVEGVHNLTKMLEQIDDQTKIVWICNPNNPTGTYVNEVELENFIRAVPESTYVVVDEAYVEYATATDFPNTIKLLQKYKNVIILRTFSKAYGLASFRIGYGIGNAELMAELNIVRLPFNTSMIAQVVAMVALDDQQFIEHCVIENTKGLEQYIKFCKEQDIPYFPSQTNFIFMEVENSGEVFEKLQSKGYIIRAFPQGIRITIGSKEENEELIYHLKEVLNHKIIQN